MNAATFLLLQTVQQSISNSAQTSRRRNTESTSSYEQNRKIPMYSTSCCGDTTVQQDVMYCSIILPQENLYCRTLYTTSVQTLIPSEVVEDMSVCGTLDSVKEVK